MDKRSPEWCSTKAPPLMGSRVSALVFQDLVTLVEQLARFLGVSCDKAQLESLTEHCHQLLDQCCNAEALPVGRGTCPPGPGPPPPPPASSCFPDAYSPPGPESCFSFISPEPSAPQGGGQEGNPKWATEDPGSPRWSRPVALHRVWSSRGGGCWGGHVSGSLGKRFSGRHLLRWPPPWRWVWGCGVEEHRVCTRLPRAPAGSRGPCEQGPSPSVPQGRQPHR